MARSLFLSYVSDSGLCHPFSINIIIKHDNTITVTTSRANVPSCQLRAYALKMIFQEPDAQVPSPLSPCSLHACIPPAVPTRFNIYPTLNNRCAGLHQQDSPYLGGGRKCGQARRGGTRGTPGLVSTLHHIRHFL